MSSRQYCKYRGYFIFHVQLKLSQRYHHRITRVFLTEQVKSVITLFAERAGDRSVKRYLRKAAAKIWIVLPDPRNEDGILIDTAILCAACSLTRREE